MAENSKFYLELEALKKYDALLKQHIPIIGTTAYFEGVKTTVPPRGQLVIFSDLRSIEITNSDNSKSTITSAGIKVGDGIKTIEQLPFIDWFYWDHINDANIHVTAEEKTFWNNKITCEVSEVDETLKLKKD